MLCTKCGKEFDTIGNRCPECGTAYTVTPPHRASAGPSDPRFIVQQTSSELITRMLVKNDKDKFYGSTRLQNFLFTVAVALTGGALCGIAYLLMRIF